MGRRVEYGEGRREGVCDDDWFLDLRLGMGLGIGDWVCVCQLT